VIHNAGPNHIHVHVNQTLNQMVVCFHRRRMIPVLPESTFSLLPLIIFLPRPSCYQLYGFRDDISFSVVSYQEMDVVGGHHVIQNAQTKAFPGLEKPSQPSPSVPGKLQQKFFLMAAMGNVPDNPRNVMPICSWHFHTSFLKRPFSWQKRQSKPKNRPIFKLLLQYFN